MAKVRQHGEVLIGRYEVLRLVNIGQTSVGYHCKDRHTGALVLVRQLLEQPSRPNGRVALSLQDQAKHADGCEEPRILDSFEYDGAVFLVCEVGPAHGAG